jgi:ABC-type multidrug transport system ATPase subunit
MPAWCPASYAVLTMPAIETEALIHQFGDQVVLRDVNLIVPDGAIYGFLGPNGAGKTTTLKLLLGLLRRQRGAIRIFGRPLERERLAILRRVGSSIESPSIYGQLTAVENLDVWRRAIGCPKARIPAALASVGLADTGRKRAREFSLGMKQRLSIAVALLHEPSLLILDEPTNGLDPQGILEMRTLFERLNREHGTTILVSSHILSEVERLVTHVAVIHRGTIRFQGPLDRLRERQQTSSYTAVDTSDSARTLAVLRQLGLTGRVESGRVLVRALSREEAGRLTATLAAGGVAIYEVATVRTDLERIFFELVRAD